MAGHDIVLGLDLEDDAASSFSSNFPESTFLKANIREVKPEQLAPLIAGGEGPTIFCGCAPCQPFSKQRARTLRAGLAKNLLSEFTRMVHFWTPDFVLIENVPGLQNIKGNSSPLRRFERQLKAMGYSYSKGVLSASSYGVPQTRSRFVLLACRHGAIELPPSTHGRGLQPFSTVQDWIETLPALDAGHSDPRDPIHRAARLSQLNLKRIAATPEGGDRRAWPDDLWLDCHRVHEGHTDVYGRLAWKKTASALTTRCTSYSNGRFGHPTQHRAISAREAACLQTFPQEYVFSGNLVSLSRQIGNAVPPLMAYNLGLAIRDKIMSANLATVSTGG